MTISGFSTVLYDFATTSQSVTLSSGQAATANFDARTCLVGSIAMNQTVSGTLASGNCSLGSGEFIDWWLFSLDSSTEVQIDLKSSQFNAYLIVTDLMTTSLAQDDDGGSGGDAQITITLGAGDYLIWATSSSVGESGSYQLSVGSGGGGQTGCQEAAISMNSTVSGSLATTDCTLSAGEYADKWTFTLASSTSVQIALNSSAFDAYLRVTDGDGSTVAEDDDGGAGQNSLIVATLAAGSYTIWATSLAPDETGAYQLSLQEVSGSPDLVVDSVTVPASATRGDTIQVFVSVTNVGNGPAGSFRIGLYWSTDTSISTADQLSASCTISALSAGGRATCTGGMTVPTSLNAGTYYLGAIADDENAVTESDETNNTGRSSQIVIS